MENFSQAITDNMDRVLLDFTEVVTDLVVLIDLSDARAYTDRQQDSLNSILTLCMNFRSIVAHSSRSGSFLPARSRAYRILSDYQLNPEVKYVPFDDTQAAAFLRVTPPKLDGITNSELKNLTGFNPSLMAVYVRTKEKKYVNQHVLSEVRTFIDSIVPTTLKDDNFYWVRKNLPISKNFFYYATNECDIPKSDLDEYLTSWINTESITYILQITAENFKLAVNFPQAIPLLMSLFRGCKESGLKSTYVDGLFFADAICRDIKTLFIKYSKTKDITNDIKFTIEAPSKSLQKTALQKIYPGILYHFRDFHRTIDAVGCFTDEEDAKWLVMIRISLSTYKRHKSEAADFLKEHIGSEKTIDDSHSLFEYYRNRIGDVTDSEKFIDPSVIKCMYVYISPNEFFSQTNPGEILGDVGICSDDTNDLYFGLVHEQSDTGQFISDAYDKL